VAVSALQSQNNPRSRPLESINYELLFL